MIKTRSLTIVILLGFFISIIFSVIFSFAEQLTLTAYYPSPNICYNQLNTTNIFVSNSARIGHSLGVGQQVANVGSDISVVRTGETANLVIFGQGDDNFVNSNHAELALGSIGADPHIWKMANSIDENKLAYLYHRPGDTGADGPIFKPILTMNATGNVGLNNMVDPQAAFHISDPQRDLVRLESPHSQGTGIMFRNTHADMGTGQYFALGWGGAKFPGYKNRFKFWYTGNDTFHASNPIMTLRRNGGIDRVGIGVDIAQYSVLEVEGGAMFNTTATGEEFIVRDNSKGSEDNVILYDYSEGRVYLGNQFRWWEDLPTIIPEVTIRNDLIVDNDLTVTRNLKVDNNDGNPSTVGSVSVGGLLCINGRCTGKLPEWEPQVRRKPGNWKEVQVKVYDKNNIFSSSGWHTIYECGLDNCGARGAFPDNWIWLNDD